jgi:hypothetical protein
MVIFLNIIYHLYIDRDGSVGVATRYGMDGLGNDSLWRRFFAPLHYPAFYTVFTVSFPGERGPGRDVDYPCPYTATLEND